MSNYGIAYRDGRDVHIVQRGTRSDMLTLLPRYNSNGVDAFYVFEIDPETAQQEPNKG